MAQSSYRPSTDTSNWSSALNRLGTTGRWVRDPASFAPVIAVPRVIQVAAGADTSYPAFWIASATALTLRKLSTETVCVLKSHETVAVGSIDLIALSIVAVQCPQLIPGTVKLLIYVSFSLIFRWALPAEEGQGKKYFEKLDLPVGGSPRYLIQR